MADLENKEPIVIRLWDFLAYKGLSAYTLGQQLGYSSSEKISRLFRIDGSKPSVDIVADITNMFAELNIEWWILGKGKMLKSENDSDIGLNSKVINLPKVVVTDDKGLETIVMMDSKAAAGFPLHIDDMDYYRKLPTLKIPRISEKQGTYICVQIDGNSMEPTIMHSQWVVGKYEEDPFDSVRSGDICLIVTTKGVICKRVYLKDRKNRIIECVSDNDDFSPFDLSIGDYIQIYKYECEISFNSRPRTIDTHKELKVISKRIDKIERHLQI